MSFTGRLRILLRLALLLIWLSLCLIAYALAKPFTRHNPIPPYFLGGAAWLVGVRLRAEGTPLRRNALLLANHISWLDILALAGASGTVFVAKGELRQAPLVGWLASLNETVFIERDARLTVSGQVDAMRRALVGGRPVTLFPEGTTGNGVQLLPFKTAMLQVFDPAPEGIRVQPVLLDYGAATRDIAWVDDESGLNNALRVLARSGYIPLTIRFLEPFTPDAQAGRKVIASKVRRRMERALQAG